MKKRYLMIVTMATLLIFLAIPVVHLVKTKLNETSQKRTIPRGFTDDESHLNLTKIDTLLKVPANTEEMINQLRWVLAYAKQNKLKISIAGARHSMGGHTMSKNGIVINMLAYKNMKIDTISNILTIGSGAKGKGAVSSGQRAGTL